MKKVIKNQYSLFLFLVVLSLIQFLNSCVERDIDSELGNTKIYFSNSVVGINFIDSTTIDVMRQNLDTTIYMLGIYKSGIARNNEEITINIKIDSLYLASKIIESQNSSKLENESFNGYKNSEALGGYFCNIPEKVTIPRGERRATIPLVISKSRIKLYKNEYFNYSKLEFNNPDVVKDRKMIIPLFITSSTPEYPILETRRRCNIEVLKQLIIVE